MSHALAKRQTPSLGLLRRPAVPYDLVQDVGGGLKIRRRDDPILSRFARRQDEREYRLMRDTTDAISSSIGALHAFLLGFGFKVSQPRSRRRGEAAQKLVEMADAQLRHLWRTAHLHVVLEQASYGFYDGWMPMQCVWDTQAFWYQGQWRWGVNAVIEQYQELYAFTAEPRPRLVELNRYAGTGNPDPPRVIPEDEEAGWLLFHSGSNLSPYGDAFLQRLWLPWRVLQSFSEWYYRGARNAFSGVPVVKESLVAAASPLMRAAGGVDPGEGAAALAALSSEAREVLRIYEEQGIIIIRGGFDFELLTDIAFGDGWQAALQYLETKFTVAIKGETLTSEVKDSGSRAVADVHQATKLTYAQRLARHIEPGVSELLKRVIEANEGEVDPEDLPAFSFRVHRRSDPEKVELLARNGAKVAIEPLADEWGIELAPEDAEEGTYLTPPKATPAAAPSDEGERDGRVGRPIRRPQDEDQDQPARPTRERRAALG